MTQEQEFYPICDLQNCRVTSVDNLSFAQLKNPLTGSSTALLDGQDRHRAGPGGDHPQKIPLVPNFVSWLEIRAAKMPIGFGDGGRISLTDRLSPYRMQIQIDCRQSARCKKEGKKGECNARFDKNFSLIGTLARPPWGIIRVVGGTGSGVAPKY